MSPDHIVVADVIIGFVLASLACGATTFFFQVPRLLSRIATNLTETNKIMSQVSDIAAKFEADMASIRASFNTLSSSAVATQQQLADALAKLQAAAAAGNPLSADDVASLTTALTAADGLASDMQAAAAKLPAPAVPPAPVTTPAGTTPAATPATPSA